MNPMSLRQTLNAVFEDLQRKDKKLTPYKIAKITPDLDPNHLREALQGKRGFSDGMLKTLGSSEYVPYSYEELRRMKAQDEFPDQFTDEAIIEQIRHRYPNLEDRKKLIREILRED
jgi:hypothetical protein